MISHVGGKKLFVRSFLSSVRSFCYFSWLWTAVYSSAPRTKLGSARNIGKSRFRPFTFFIFRRWFFLLFFAKIFEVDFCFKKVSFLWSRRKFAIRVGRCVVKSYCLKYPYFRDFLGEGVNDSIRVETLNLAPKITSTIWCFDVMIMWSE